MAKPLLSTYPFGRGLHQENDDRLQEAGNPRALQNLIRTKNGRLQSRRDYEAIAMTGTGSTGRGTGTLTNLRLYDLAEYSGRILGFGRADTNTVVDNYPIDSTQDIFELLEAPTGNWRKALTSELAQGTEARFVGRIGRKATSITVMDVAAANGRVCVVYELQARFPLSSAVSVGVHIFEAATDTTLFSAGISGMEKPRVVAVDGVFFIGCVQTSNGAITLRRYNPASDTALVVLTQPVAAGGTVNGWDMKASHTSSSFWIAVARTGSVSALRGLNNAGTVTFTTAGPATTWSGIAALHGIVAGVERLHIAGTRSTGEVDLYTYEPPGTSPTDSATDALGSAVCVSQFGLAFGGDFYGAQNIVGVGTFSNEQVTSYNVESSTLTASLSANVNIDACISSPVSVKRRVCFGVSIQEYETFYTHGMMKHADSINALGFRPVCVFDRFLGHILSQFHLPSAAIDASTGLAYQVVATEDNDRQCSPQVLEIRIAGDRRRQTVQLGDTLYISGGIVQAFDGRHSQEAGGFLTRPVLRVFQSQGSPAGNLDLLGSYQGLCVAEYRDSKNRRIQSAVSNLRQETLFSSDQTIQAVARGPLSMRDSAAIDEITPIELQNTPTISFYRTLNIDDGNGTFHLDQAYPTAELSRLVTADVDLVQSDSDLSDNEILYSQGARGALSGPLEFVCPDGAGSLCASADRVLTGQLLNDTQIQESRPLFPGEQVQWSDTAGFYRDVRNRVLAVARLDERRILLTATELFECDGPGLDDNGIGDIGPPRRLPSDVGLYGGIHGWRSIVEISAGILFQGLRNQIYLLPRGGVTPIPIGFSIEDILSEYPDIASAVYINEDQTVRFACNNEEGDASIVLLFNVRFTEWYVEGPYEFGIRATAKLRGQHVMLTTDNTLLRQRTEDAPLTFVPVSWSGGIMHPWKQGMFGRFDAVWFYGGVLGDCRIRVALRFDEGPPEYSDWVDVFEREDGSQFVHRFAFNQMKCESIRIDFEIESLQSRPTRGLTWNYFAIEGEPSDAVNQVGSEDMS